MDTPRKIKTIPLPSAEFLNECFTYDENTGELIWKERPLHHFLTPREQKRFNTIYSGTTSGNKVWLRDKFTGKKRKKCMQVNFWNRETQKLVAYTVHRIIYAMKEIPIPDGDVIDHIDNDPWNNRLSNLRIVTTTQSAMNRKPRRGKQSGAPIGVGWCKRSQKHIAYIRVDKRLVHLGYFNEMEPAIAARKAAEEHYFGEHAWSSEKCSNNSLAD